MLEMLVGVLGAVLAGLGIGGGGLLVIYLVFVRDMPQLEAQGINLIFFVISSCAAMTVHLKKRRLPFLFIAICAGAGLFGAAIGNRAAQELSQGQIRMLFGILLVVSGTLALFKRKK